MANDRDSLKKSRSNKRDLKRGEIHREKCKILWEIVGKNENVENKEAFEKSSKFRKMKINDSLVPENLHLETHFNHTFVSFTSSLFPIHSLIPHRAHLHRDSTNEQKKNVSTDNKPYRNHSHSTESMAVLNAYIQRLPVLNKSGHITRALQCIFLYELSVRSI